MDKICDGCSCVFKFFDSISQKPDYMIFYFDSFDIGGENE